jgi:protein SCO1
MNYLMMARSAVICSMVLIVFCFAAYAKRMDVIGMVLRVDRTNSSVLVSHQDIPGYMPAMVMTFSVRSKLDLDRINPGQVIRFRLSTNGKDAIIDRVRPYASTAGLSVVSASFSIDAPREQVRTGEAVPDFTLTDQSNRIVRLSDFKGRVVVLAFIYTRCPLANVCPRLAANFATIQTRFRPYLGQTLQLLTITIDPQHDTPAVLSDYARRWNADPKGWFFLTGKLDYIREVAKRFGLVFWPESGYVTHTVQTAIVDADGTLAAVVEGTSYNLIHLLELVRSRLSHL